MIVTGSAYSKWLVLQNGIHTNGMGKENPMVYKQSNFFWEMALAYGRVSVMWKIHVAQP